MTELHRERLKGCEVLPAMKSQAPATTPKQTPRNGKRRKTTAGRFRVLNQLVDETMRHLKRNELAVWLILYRDSRDGIASTAQSDMARRAGISDRTVRRVLKQLEGYGLLRTVYRGGINRGPSKYRVLPFNDILTADKAVSG